MKEQGTAASKVEARQAAVRRQPRFWPHAMLFLACVLLVNALFGERGLTETLRARRVYAAAIADVARIHAENEQLRDQAERLQNDPATIESVARARLGMARREEIVVTVHDEK